VSDSSLSTSTTSTTSRRGFLAGAAGSALALAGAAPSSAASSSTDAVFTWYDLTTSVVAAAALPPQVGNSRTWAVAWIAAARAVRDVGGSPAGQVAALASAVHDALLAQVPAQGGALDAALTATLGTLPDGRPRRRGVAIGARAAREVLAERAGDGLDVAHVNIPWTPPPPAPGIWQPTPPAFGPAIQAGEGRATPFLLGRPDRFRLGPPPGLDDPEYLASLAEVTAYGSADSTVRDAEQTGIGEFWAQPLPTPPAGYTGVLRAALLGAPGLSEQVRLVAAFHAITADAQIAVYDTKYTYLRWRPVTAIRAGHGALAPDPGWTPVIVTPSHPEYASGHATFAGAAERVLTALVGPRARQPFALTSPTAPGLVLTYRAWRELTGDSVNARVWTGVHFRFSDERGARLGRTVADYGLQRVNRLLG
jgi:hypothetical protein